MATICTFLPFAPDPDFSVYAPTSGFGFIWVLEFLERGICINCLLVSSTVL